MITNMNKNKRKEKMKMTKKEQKKKTDQSWEDEGREIEIKEGVLIYNVM